MEEIRATDKATLPGLVRPYCSDSKTTDSIQGCRMNGKLNRLDPKLDPYSIYDDDSDQDHYFLVPGNKLDLVRFQKAFKEMNSLRSKQTHHHLSNTHKTIPCPNRTRISGRNTYSSSSDNDEYCMLSQDSKIEKYHAMSQNFHPSNTNMQHIKKENLEKFASKLVTNSADIKNGHSFKKDSYVEFDINKEGGGVYTKKSSKKKKKVDTIIDYCTCMLCVRSISYHWTSDDEGDFVEPCSCSGSSKSVFGRWFCMGIVALFFPCLFCYLPAKLCQTSVTECGSRTKLKDDTYRVRYVADTHITNNNNMQQ